VILNDEQLVDLHGWISRFAFEGEKHGPKLALALHAALEIDPNEVKGNANYRRGFTDAVQLMQSEIIKQLHPRRSRTDDHDDED
jgi:hypothetical protein